MKTLYVTSFSKTLFQASGHLMIESFVKNQIGDLLVAYETFNFPAVVVNVPQIKHVDIMQYPFLINWLKDNENVIPTIFGGKMPAPSESGPPDGNKKLQKKVHDYWNKKASLWFRKVAALHYAINHYPEYDNIVWIDCDCIFKQKLPENLINTLLKNHDIFYHQGAYRNSKNFGFETGFIGFKKGNGTNVINLVSNFYINKKYIALNRWDDGYIFKVIIQELEKKKKLKTIDLVDSNKPGKRLEAINKGLFCDFLLHNKGLHKNLPDLGDDKHKK